MARVMWVMGPAPQPLRRARRTRFCGLVLALPAAVDEVVRLFQHMFRRNVFLAHGRDGILIREPSEPAVFARRDTNIRLACFSKKKDDGIVDAFVPRAERELLVRPESGDDAKLGRLDAGLFFRLTERCCHTFFPFFKVAFREIPIASPLVEKEVFYAVRRPAKDDKAGDDLLFFSDAGAPVTFRVLGRIWFPLHV